jgi:hypothetical protein
MWNRRIGPGGIVFFVLFAASTARAHDIYGVGGFGATLEGDPLVNLGAGVDFGVAGGFGAGAELGFMPPAGNWHNGLGALSLNGRQRFRSVAEGIVPFVSGGYTLLFRPDFDSVHGGNIGGGMDYRMRNGRAVRVDFRWYLEGESGPFFGRVGFVF